VSGSFDVGIVAVTVALVGFVASLVGAVAELAVVSPLPVDPSSSESPASPQPSTIAKSPAPAKDPIEVRTAGG